MTFRKGSVVRLKTGNSPIRVIDVRRFHRIDWHSMANRYGGTARRAPDGDPMMVKFAYLSQEYSDSETGKLHYESPKWREARDFTAHEDYQDGNETLERTGKMTQKLYKTKDGKYGTFLTRDSEGNFVLELKGGEGVKAYLQADLEEVRPYAVEITLLGHGDGKRDYAFKKGSVKLGDVLIHVSTGKVYHVTKLDSKKEPRQSENGFIKIASTKDVIKTEK